MDVEIGKYILPGDEVISVWPPEEVDGRIVRSLRDSLLLGLERTPHQDLKLGVIELMDIAVKAMSPSVNDPTTALNAIDRLGEILLELSWRSRGDLVELSSNGRPLLITRRPELEATVGIAFDQVRHYAASNPTVAIAMVRLLGRLAAMAPESAGPVFVQCLHEVKATAEAQITDAVDQRRFAHSVTESMKIAAGTGRVGIEAGGG